MFKIVRLIALLIFVSFPTLSTALTVTLFDEAMGQVSPPLVNQPVFQNGDFTVRPCCTPPVLNDATEEIVLWTMDLSGQVPQRVESIVSATLRLRFRTGGDTPFNDALVFNGRGTFPFGFTQRFSSYDTTFDLLDLYGDAVFIDTLNASGTFSFATVNDSYPYFAQLQVVAATVPLPATAWLMLLGLGALSAFRRTAPTP